MVCVRFLVFQPPTSLLFFSYFSFLFPSILTKQLDFVEQKKKKKKKKQAAVFIVIFLWVRFIRIKTRATHAYKMVVKMDYSRNLQPSYSYQFDQDR